MSGRDETLSPEAIENTRRILVEHFSPATVNTLCALALDGLRFRAWCEGASGPLVGGDVGKLAVLMANCLTPNEYREAIDKFIVHRAKKHARG